MSESYPERQARSRPVRSRQVKKVINALVRAADRWMIDMTSAVDLPENHPLRVAHRKSLYHRAEIERSQKCGCFYREKILGADQIADILISAQAICSFRRQRDTMTISRQRCRPR